MKKTGVITDTFDYPVELVWTSIAGRNDGSITPMDEETYLNTEPEQGTVFTRSIEVKTNETFAFQIKTRMFIADWRIELKSLAPCKTGVKLTCTIEYRSFKSALLNRFGAGMTMEMHYFMRDLKKKLEKFNAS
jgi:hypothetical protein